LQIKPAKGFPFAGFSLTVVGAVVHHFYSNCSRATNICISLAELLTR
jgi:hypothetical protein